MRSHGVRPLRYDDAGTVVVLDDDERYSRSGSITQVVDMTVEVSNPSGEGGAIEAAHPDAPLTR